MNRRDFLGGVGGCGCAPYLAQNGRPEGADALLSVGSKLRITNVKVLIE